MAFTDSPTSARSGEFRQLDVSRTSLNAADPVCRREVKEFALALSHKSTASHLRQAHSETHGIADVAALRLVAEMPHVHQPLIQPPDRAMLPASPVVGIGTCHGATGFRRCMARTDFARGLADLREQCRIYHLAGPRSREPTTVREAMRRPPFRRCWPRRNPIVQFTETKFARYPTSLPDTPGPPGRVPHQEQRTLARSPRQRPTTPSPSRAHHPNVRASYRRRS